MLPDNFTSTVRTNDFVPIRRVTPSGVAVELLTRPSAISGGGTSTQGMHASTNDSGNTTISPTTTAHTEEILFSGDARTSVLVLDTAGALPGNTVDLVLLLPATSGITVEVRNATSGGTLLATLTTDDSGDNAFIRCYFNGTSFLKALAVYSS